MVAGTVANGVGALKAGQAADRMNQLAGQVPQAQRSKYPGMMLGTAQNELNANNPFLAYQNRAIQQSQANSIAAAKNMSLDPAMLLKMTEAYNANANNASAQNAQNNYNLRQGKIDNLYKAYSANQQQDQMDYDNQMTAFNSAANVRNAAAQTSINAWQNFGNGLMGAGSGLLKMSSGAGKAGTLPG